VDCFLRARRCHHRGGYEQQDEQNLLGISLSDGAKVAAGMGSHHVTMEMTCRQIIAQSSVLDRTEQRFQRTSGIAKIWFKCEKAVKKWMAWT
jgi:hypothetical protein